MIAAMALLGGIALFCAALLAYAQPALITCAWMFTLEATPEFWLDPGNPEAVIGAVKFAGLGLALLLALRYGLRRDRYNPAFAYLAMFIAGPLHGLYPGLTLLSSLRSLIGSASPFAFAFIRLPAPWCRTVIATTIRAPLVTVLLGAILAAAHIHPLYTLELGAVRLAGCGEPPFLGGFALVAVYAGVLEFSTGQPRSLAWLLINTAILLLTGARAPLLFATLLIATALLLPATNIPLARRLAILTAAGIALSLGLMFFTHITFIRSINLFEMGQASNLSNRNLVWPAFEAAFAASPWLGWGAGAGKIIVPVSSHLGGLIGTNAAHNEYLRIGTEGGALGLGLLIACLACWVYRGSRPLPRAPRWLMRLVFLAFAAHSATDNTLIATTSSIFFIWASAVFATAREASTEPS